MPPKDGLLSITRKTLIFPLPLALKPSFSLIIDIFYFSYQLECARLYS